MTARELRPLISPDVLAELISAASPLPTILDIRWQLATGADGDAYREGHIPGAVFIDLDRQLSDPPSERGRHPLPDVDRFGAEMRKAGVSGARPVVVYDAATSMAAARGWWLLRYFGHPDVAVLDGGFAAWIAAGLPVETKAPSPEPGDFAARPGSMPVLTVDDVAAIAAEGVLIDARAPERFTGVEELVDPVGGHIPGARSRPTSANLDSTGRFLSPATLRQEFQRAGVDEDVAIAAYCGSGVTAAHEVLALELAGFRAALYPGSWSEWVADPGRPVAR